ncbi:hypothetical protein T265_10005 [Opisthorchis viverrini]|uniref:Uncharacterized protein n=1 Tax=Opisthorchis viverrini TaxID=6198 RepID=A0A074Z3Z3_OPIVI|nr:hypothetical protein T265_10005 [Opisthorchis viverrini]KER21768.1 hypothetical protein T265_10005 [Opisthorchis viverrini]
MQMHLVCAPERRVYRFVKPENTAAHVFVLKNARAYETVCDCVESLCIKRQGNICGQYGPGGLKMFPGTEGRSTEQKRISIETCVVKCSIVAMVFGGTVEPCTATND